MERQASIPGYQEPTVAERLRWEVALPYSCRKQRGARLRPIASGMFDEDGRQQFDLMDAIRAEQAGQQQDR